MTDPTVTAVSELLDAAFRELQHDTGPQDIEYQHQRAALEKRFAAILRARSALADVGECETCGEHANEHGAINHAFNKSTGKQPRPELSIVRHNMLNVPGYTPYCGAEFCQQGLTRTKFDGEQFKCRCGWRSKFELEFIEEYKGKQK